MVAKCSKSKYKNVTKHLGKTRVTLGRKKVFLVGTLITTSVLRIWGKYFLGGQARWLLDPSQNAES